MVNLTDAIRARCNDLEAGVVETHFRRMPADYFERYSAADIARHLRLLAGLRAGLVVDVDVRSLATHTFEVLVVGVDCAGTLACITAALAADGFDLEDVEVSTYQDAEGEPTYFVIPLRVSGSLRGRSARALALSLRERLRVAFGFLTQGNLIEAQAAAADGGIGQADAGQPTPYPGDPTRATRPGGLQHLVLGGDFRLERKLATGGMSEVYLGTQLSLQRTVAVKLFRHDGDADDELLARFNQEAHVLAQFTCAHIVQILAAGTVVERPRGALGWMVMEHMAGGDLARWQQQNGCPPVEVACLWFRHALEGLHYAHRRGILHRDLKPHNLLLTADGHVKITDFGLLQHAQRADARITPRSAVLGTPQYMSPEQALGDLLDERSDIFSLGTTFFFLFSGRLPFEKNTAAALLVEIIERDAPSLSSVAPRVPAPVAVLIGRMMRRAREERYQDVGVILEDLASYERRGLVKFAEGTALAPGALAHSPAGADEVTQAYEPARR